jgi:MFS transporter, DHA1 family, tetracycline resistance protein
VQALTTVGQYMLLLVTPVVLEARGWSSGAIGLVLASLTVGLILMGPPGGRLGDRAGRRAPVVPGVGLTVVAVGTLAASGADVPALVLVIVLAASGIGLGFATPSIMTAALESVDESRSGTASGILSMSRYVGSISASILVSAWLADDGSGASGPLWIGTAAAMAAFASAFVLPARR